MESARVDFLGVELPLGDDLVLRVREAVGARLFPGRPRTIGRYVLERTLGRGGAGTVWRAVDPMLDRSVALKLLHAPLSSPATQARLLREARIVAGLDHPNIVEVFDVGVADDLVYVVTELVEGGDLAKWLAQPRDRDEVIAVFTAAARGLAAAHARGVVHRDFKPSNVLVTRDGVAKVADFGLAKCVDATSMSDLDVPATMNGDAVTLVSRAGVVVGTAPYMAPEQHEGGDTDERTDVYAFCVSLFEALHRQRPFVGDTLEELEAAKLRPNVVCDPMLPAGVQEVIRVGLRVDPGTRWRSMTDIVARLEHRSHRGRVTIVALAATATAALVLLASQGRRDAIAPLETAVASASASPGVPTPTTLALARVDELDDLGDYAAGLGAAREAITAAGDGPERPRALTAYGRLLSGAGRYAEAADELERAYWLAAAAGDDEIIARSAIELFQVEGLGLGRYDDAAEWKRHALAALQRIDAPAELTMRYHGVAARVEVENGDAESSLAEADAALAVARTAEVPENAVSNTKRVRADALARLGRQGEAEAALRALLEADEARLGAEHPVTIATLRSLGGTLALAGRFEEAVDVLQDAVVRTDAAFDPDAAPRASVRQALAAALAAAERREEAAEVLEDARQIAMTAFGPEALTRAIIDTNLGIARARLGQFDEASDHLHRALAQIEGSFGVGHLHTWAPVEGLAQLERQRKNPVKAAELYERCAKILARREGVAAREWFRCRTNAGQAWWLAKDPAKAEAAFRELLDIGPPDPSELADLELGLGISLRALGRNGEAVPHLERAQELYADKPPHPGRDEYVTAELDAAREN